MEPNQTLISRRWNISKLKFIIISLLLIGSVTFTAQGQTKRKNPADKSNKNASCKIGTTNFKCPDNFVKEQVVGENTILFKYK